MSWALSWHVSDWSPFTGMSYLNYQFYSNWKMNVGGNRISSHISQSVSSYSLFITIIVFNFSSSLFVLSSRTNVSCMSDNMVNITVKIFDACTSEIEVFCCCTGYKIFHLPSSHRPPTRYLSPPLSLTHTLSRIKKQTCGIGYRKLRFLALKIKDWALPSDIQ